MKYIGLSVLFLAPAIQVAAQQLDTIHAVVIDSLDERYESSIEGYQASEIWTIWSASFSVLKASSNLAAQGKSLYTVANAGDYDLRTAWVEGVPGYGIGEKIEVEVRFGEGFYGSAYNFFGEINLFNGYCKSIETWTRNSRVHLFRVYYNDFPLCDVELADTWHFQSFSIAHFFRNAYLGLYPDAPHEMKSGDRLTFEITDVYKGTKYDDVALSEFMFEGAKN